MINWKSLKGKLSRLGPISFPFKNDEKCFLFHVKSSFCSQDIYIFILTFLSLLYPQKSGLIRKLGLISKFMTSQTGQQITAIRYFPNNSRSKSNQATKFGLQKSCRKWRGDINLRRLFYCLYKALFKVRLRHTIFITF